ncbi:Endoglucanase precursor [Pseudoalteromonas luteoviolacea B = ATCC 29581]|nr:Endoglucanase precursor [Pseudoalteromonas luteoviolacea B = ATCC 29581]
MKAHIFSLMILLCSVSSNAQSMCYQWPHWDTFKQHFISDQGRVIDLGSKQEITTSEGQSYGLFFALVANDKSTFDKLLDWTEANLSEGDLSARLPAWLWGKRENDYGILDSNPASDSDLWIAYSLLEASRLWNERRYAVLAAVLAKRILREETEHIPGLGLTLLPGPYGFEIQDKTWRLNPSYVPLQIIRRFVDAYPHSPWQEVYDTSVQLLVKSAPKGFSPDWVLYHPDKGFHFTKKHDDIGSYNAIRVYLWISLLHPEDEQGKTLKAHFVPMVKATAKQGHVPVNVFAQSGHYEKRGSVGFNASMLKFLDSSQEINALVSIKQHIDHNITDELSKHYYSSVLSLFGTGAFDNRYSFSLDGKLLPQWEQQCSE